MAFKDRIALIMTERQLNQSALAKMMGIKGSYISHMLAGRVDTFSTAVAQLVEKNLGYNAQWVLTGDGPKFVLEASVPVVSSIHEQVLTHLQRMTEDQARSVLAFIESLERLEAAKDQRARGIVSDNTARGTGVQAVE